MSTDELEQDSGGGRDASLLDDRDVIGYIDRAEDGIVVLDDEGVVTYANLAARDLLAPNRAGRLEGACLGTPLAVDGHQRLELATSSGSALSVDARITPCRFNDRSGWVISLRRLSDAMAGGLDATFHELRNNLTGMQATLEGLHEETEPDIRSQMLEMLQRRVRRMSLTLDGFLDATSMAEGMFRSNHDECDVAEALHAYFDETGLPLRTTLSIPPNLTVTARPGHVQSVVANYVGNAIKYGAPPVEIYAHRVQEFIEIVVRDHGSGVADDFVDSLFDRYRRANSAISAQGSGLGLWIVKSIATAYGGSAGYRPAGQGGGAEFWCRLPDAHPISMSRLN
jgi:signal transduction histidine kinase